MVMGKNIIDESQDEKSEEAENKRDRYMANKFVFNVLNFDMSI